MSTNSTVRQPLRRAANLGRSRLSRRPEPAQSRPPEGDPRAKLPALPGRKENHFHHA
jgi:hypothetical protein